MVHVCSVEYVTDDTADGEDDFTVIMCLNAEPAQPYTPCPQGERGHGDNRLYHGVKGVLYVGVKLG